MNFEINGMKFTIDFPDNYYIKGVDVPEIEGVLCNCLKTIVETNNIRIIVIETWLISEYFVRLSLSYAFDIGRYKCEDLDPKYELLPNSFKACIDMLEKLLNSQRGLPIENVVTTLNVSMDFFMYIKHKYPDILQKLMELDQEYTNINKSEEFEKLIYTPYLGTYQNKKWTSSLEHIDDVWFRNIKRINSIRNIAAHNYNPDIIYQQLGFSGKTALEKSRKFCLELIYKMFYVKIEK